MNAVLDHPAQSGELRIPGRDLSWINATLSQWGEWIWRNRHFEGYPTADAVKAFLHGAGATGNADGLPGWTPHRILCRDPPPWFTLTHVIVLMLPEHEGVTVFAEYVPGVDDDGRILSRAQKCAKVGVEEECFRKRLQRARQRIWDWSRRNRR